MRIEVNVMLLFFFCNTGRCLLSYREEQSEQSRLYDPITKT